MLWAISCDYFLASAIYLLIHYLAPGENSGFTVGPTGNVLIEKRLDREGEILPGHSLSFDNFSTLLTESTALDPTEGTDLPFCQLHLSSSECVLVSFTSKSIANRTILVVVL